MPFEYYENPRLDVIDFLKSKANLDISYRNVLDIGCASGEFGVNLQKYLELNDFQWTGIEPVKELPNSKFNYNLLGKCIHSEFPNCMSELPDGFYDCIFALDVLEHLPNPDIALDLLRKKIKGNGNLIVSLPNVSNYSILIQLFKQRWDYKESGIMDKTHLRFFTPSSFDDIARRNNWVIKSIKPINSFEGLKHNIFNFIKFVFPKYIVNFLSYGHIYRLCPSID